MRTNSTFGLPSAGVFGEPTAPARLSRLTPARNGTPAAASAVLLRKSPLVPKSYPLQGRPVRVIVATATSPTPRGLAVREKGVCERTLEVGDAGLEPATSSL